MPEFDSRTLAEFIDKQHIAELLHTERFWRDQGEWEKLAACYTDDSWVHTTWFRGGTGREFAAASKEMAERRGRHSRHMITPTVIRIDGDRALAESLGEIHNRDVVHDVEVDTIQYCRFFSRVVRRSDGWRLASFEGIYHKDVITPVNPAAKLELDWRELSGFRAPYRIWAYMLSRKGYTVPQGDDIVADDRPDVLAAFYARAEHWLRTGEYPPAS